VLRRHRESRHLVDSDRVALLGDEQPLADLIVGQALEALVAVTVDAQRELRRVRGIDDRRSLIDLDPKQALPALVADHIHAGGDVLDSLRIAEADQRDRAQQIALQAEFEQMRVAIGDGDQTVAIGIEGQRREIVLNATDHLALDRRLVIRQPQ